MSHTSKGIPTVGPRNIQFRSRIEAQWAYIFTEFGWDWEYEPFDLKGYIPDFIINFHDKQLLVEVKGETNIWTPGTLDNDNIYQGGYHDYVKKIYESGWKGHYMIVGCNYKSVELPRTMLASLIGVSGSIGMYKFNDQRWDVTGQIEWAKELYGKKYDYSKFKPFGSDIYIRFLENDTIVLQEEHGEVFSKTPVAKDTDNPNSHNMFQRIWSSAKNKVQWKSPTAQSVQKSIYDNAQHVITPKDVLESDDLSEEIKTEFREWWEAKEVTTSDGSKLTSSPILPASAQALNKLAEECDVGPLVSPYFKNIEDILRCDLVVNESKRRLIECLKRVIDHHDIRNEEPIWGNCDIRCYRDNLVYIYKVHADKSVSFVKSFDSKKYWNLKLA